MNNSIENVFFSTNQQKVLRFLAKNPMKGLMASEIIKDTKLSKSGVNLALSSLVRANFVEKEVKGKTYLYQINHNRPLVKQFKVIENIVKLSSLLKKLGNINAVNQVIIFGSAARGENYIDSDIDLFVLAHDKQEVVEIFSKIKSVQAIVKTPAELVSMEKKNPVLCQEIGRGIVILEKYD
ncbi:nucleotidyltransferase domain-containing protein [Patescibacteria group bacterium]|nr:nucleotidyltransferase domain-containing protein [Patescibacteria group bacterium]